MMTEMRVTVRQATRKPDYQKTAMALLERCREFHQNPENERAFQEWNTQRGTQNEEV